MLLPMPGATLGKLLNRSTRKHGSHPTKSTMIIPSVPDRLRGFHLIGATALVCLVGCDGPSQPVPDVRTWTSVSAGSAHTCGILSDGTGYCWGNNGLGQVISPPSAGGTSVVALPLRWRTLAAGGSLTCGTTTTGETNCWGRIAGLMDQPRPLRRVDPDPGFSAIAAGTSHVCGLTANGAAYCWGDNFRGQLGIGRIDGAGWLNRSEPTRVGASPPFVQIIPGDEYTCALTNGQELYCWGTGFTSDIDDTPVRAGVDVRPASLASGGANERSHFCGRSGEHLFCWGHNVSGQLGAGFTSDISTGYRSPPVAVSEPAGVRLDRATAGGGVSSQGYFGHTCALSENGTAYCWGDNGFGQLGDGTTMSRWTPVLVSASERFIEISAGGRHTCGVTREGEMLCWGDGRDGQIGGGGSGQANPTPSSVHVPR
jgi:alpha-tubulin suppressor-like RCC1 family protein